MEPISAMEVLTARNPIHATRYIQISPAVPPLIRPMMDVLLVLSICGDILFSGDWLTPTQFPSWP